MTLAEQFDAFLENTVNLNPHRIASLDERVAAVTKYLHDDPTFADLFLDVTPQGSYAHRTIIKPVGTSEYDADVLLILKQHPDWTPADYTAELRRSFRRSSRYKDMAHKRSRCVCIDYANEFHIDVVPYVESRDSITNNKGGFNGEGEWQVAYPERFTEWLEGRYRLTNDHLPEVIRLLKYLRDYKKTFSVKSVILSILVGNVVADPVPGEPTAYPDIPTTFVKVLEDLASYLWSNPVMPWLMDPAGSGQDFRNRWDQDRYSNFRSRIGVYAAKARAALDADDDHSLQLWQDIFGPDFKEVAAPTVTLAHSAPGEQSLASRGIEERLSASVRLVGRVRGLGIQRAYDLPSRGDRVAKGRTIDFRIDNCTAVGEFEVYWKVKNFGQEALDANCPRGEVTSGGSGRWETTSYWGNHYVEVYIVQNGACVARDQQRVIVTKNR